MWSFFDPNTYNWYFPRLLGPTLTYSFCGCEHKSRTQDANLTREKLDQDIKFGISQICPECNVLRPYQQTPKGAYPKPPGPTVYGLEFLEHLGMKGDVWGMLQGYVGFPLEMS